MTPDQLHDPELAILIAARDLVAAALPPPISRSYAQPAIFFPRLCRVYAATHKAA